jgi:hypothetical protein
MNCRRGERFARVVSLPVVQKNVEQVERKEAQCSCIEITQLGLGSSDYAVAKG